MTEVKQLHQAELVVGLEFDIELECLTTLYSFSNIINT